MSNTSIQLKKSGITGNTPVDLNYGELALNYADGKLYYKDYYNIIKFISNQDTFATVNINSVPVMATSTTDILSIVPQEGIKITVDAIDKIAYLKVDEFVRKTGDGMTGDLILDTSTVHANNIVVNHVLYSGLATEAATPLPNLIAQFTSNSSSYVQVNAQNIDPEGSADYVVTADVGNDTDFYIDMGINNSLFDNSDSTAEYPLDGYLIVQGSTIGQAGGNLVIGTSGATTGLNTKIVSGGLDTENIVAEFGENGVQVYNDLNVDGSITGPTINNTIALAQAAFDKANTGGASNASFDQANAAFDQANSAYTLAQNAYNYANTISQVVRTSNTLVISETTGLVDKFNISEFAGAKYQIQTSSFLGYENFDLSVIADSTTTKFNVFNSFYTSETLGEITASNDGTYAYIYYTPVTPPTNLVFVRDSFAIMSIPFPTPLDLMEGSTTVDLLDGGTAFDLMSTY